MEKWKELFKKYREPILYLVFGVLTTVVNYVIYLPCSYFGLGWTFSTVAAWVAAVLFAYVTNRIWVFENRAYGLSGIVQEFSKFIIFRLASLGLDLLTMWFCMEVLRMDRLFLPDIQLGDLSPGEVLAKTIAQVVVVVSNYIFSKCFIFRRRS